jgi:hypothetical protein
VSNPLTIIPWPVCQFFDNNGEPLNGGLLYTYASGTTTNQATYSDANGTPNTNPVVLDSSGRCRVFLSATSYKFVLTPSVVPPPVSPSGAIWTIDGVPSTGLSQSIVGIGATAYNFGGSEFSPITATNYPSGITADTCLANSAFFFIDSALLVGTFGIRAMIESVAGITTTVAIMNLSDGSPDTPIQSMTGTSTTGSLVTSLAIPFATAGVVKAYGIKVKVSSGTGFVWQASLTRLT